jgi:hypothetical protein
MGTITGAVEGTVRADRTLNKSTARDHKSSLSTLKEESLCKDRLSSKAEHLLWNKLLKNDETLFLERG